MFLHDPQIVSNGVWLRWGKLDFKPSLNRLKSSRWEDAGNVNIIKIITILKSIVSFCFAACPTGCSSCTYNANSQTTSCNTKGCSAGFMQVSSGTCLGAFCSRLILWLIKKTEAYWHEGWNTVWTVSRKDSKLFFLCEVAENFRGGSAIRK